MVELIIEPATGESEEDMTVTECVNMCMCIWETFESVDIEVLPPNDKRMIRQMRSWAIQIPHYYLQSIHRDIYGDKKTGKLGTDE